MIPSQFELGGLTIKVITDETLYKRLKHGALAEYTRQLITIDPSMQVPESIEESFYHEKVHWILFMMGEMELCNNEKFVDLFAQFLYQAIKTGSKAEQLNFFEEDEGSDI